MFISKFLGANPLLTYTLSFAAKDYMATLKVGTSKTRAFAQSGARRALTMTKLLAFPDPAELVVLRYSR
jgi:hypothetical protein